VPFLLPAFQSSPVAKMPFAAGQCKRAMPMSGTLHATGDYFFANQKSRRTAMARKYSKKASADVERVMKKRKAGTLKSGGSGRKVKSRKQAIAIGLSEARAKGKKVPKKASKKRKTAKKKTAKKSKR
jgi:hypothetical protein